MKKILNLYNVKIMFKHVFKPIKIKNIHIKNRLVFPAFNTSYATEQGFVTDRLIRFHNNISKGEAGINIVGATSVSKDGRVNYYGLRIDDNKYIPGLMKLFSAIQKHGTIAAIQLTHAGSQTTSMVIGTKPVAPSNIPNYFKEIPKALKKCEIKRIIQDFGNAALRAINAGAKAIELHAAHGYLIHQFLSPLTNNRKDYYGGSLIDRFRFLKEIITEIKEKIGDDIILLCRISAEEFINGGLTIEDSILIANEIEKSSIDIIDVSAGVYGQKHILYPTTIKYRDIRINLASKIKSAINIPVICSGHISNLSQAEKILEERKADFAALGRALIADPFLIKKSRKKQYHLINNCVWCNECVYDWQSRNTLTCHKNPIL